MTDEQSHAGPLLACSRCDAPTPQATLNSFGARCSICYLAFCRQQQPRVLVGSKANGPRDWALALQAREKSGERLSPAVRTMWRAALNLPDGSAA